MERKIAKPILKRNKNSATARLHQVNEDKSTPLLKDVFAPEVLDKETWGRFLLFVEATYEDLITSFQEEKCQRSNILQSAIKRLNQFHQESWEKILEKTPQAERLDADELYKFISRGKSLTPQEVYQESQMAIRDLINNAEYGFLDTDNRDIGRISQLCDAINYFQNSQSKTYLILSQLEEAVPENAKPFFAASKVFQQIIDAGVTRKLQDFGMTLMRHFRVTRTAIKDEAASNLVIGMGEIERNLRTQITMLEQEKAELAYQLQKIRDKAHQEALTEIASALQNSGQPALDQIQQILHLLEAQVEETGETELNSDQALSIFIVLRNLMQTLKRLGIESYPDSLEEIIEISQDNLAKYAYTGGSSFTDDFDTKKVECIRQGWRVGEIVITPAKVKELSV